MSRVDFYILDDGADPLPFACRLVERIYRLRHTVYVHAAGAEHARALDEALWSFKAGAFVPHRRTGEAGEAPVWIGWDPEIQHAADVLVNLSPEVPAGYERYARIAELVPADPQGRAQARARYRQYRERGATLAEHHTEA